MFRCFLQGAGLGLQNAAERGNHSVLKVILEHWNPSDPDMVNCKQITNLCVLLVPCSGSVCCLRCKHALSCADYDHSQADSFISEALGKAVKAGHTASVRLMLPHCISEGLISRVRLFPCF